MSTIEFPPRPVCPPDAPEIDRDLAEIYHGATMIRGARPYDRVLRAEFRTAYQSTDPEHLALYTREDPAEATGRRFDWFHVVSIPAEPVHLCGHGRTYAAAVRSLRDAVRKAVAAEYAEREAWLADARRHHPALDPTRG